jgi:hypothetical protein
MNIFSKMLGKIMSTNFMNLKCKVRFLNYRRDHSSRDSASSVEPNIIIIVGSCEDAPRTGNVADGSGSG